MISFITIKTNPIFPEPLSDLKGIRVEFFQWLNGKEAIGVVSRIMYSTWFHRYMKFIDKNNKAVVWKLSLVVNDMKLN